MNAQEINAAIGRLNSLAFLLESAYIENEGECTAETDQMESAIAEVKELLTTDGIDSLGRWLKAKQDEIAAAKAEVAAAQQRVKSLQRTEVYIKEVVGRVLVATGTEKAKGQYYSFAQSESHHTEVLTDALADAYGELVEKAVRKAGLPACIDVQLKTTATRMMEAGGDMLAFVDESVEPAIKFTKPRAAKE